MDIKFSIGHIRLRADVYVINTNDGIRLKIAIDSKEQESCDKEEVRHDTKR